MKKIELVNGIGSSILGFGCAPVLGAINAKKAARAIDIALEYGINHFDLARSYGYGDAEACVGKILKDRRSEVVIATKFGIKANWKASILKPLKPIVRYLKGHPKMKVDNHQGDVRVNADFFLDRLPITAVLMEQSLEQSLKSLKTDYVDILFVHEPLETIQEIESVLAFSEKCKKQGKIRGIGLACMQEQVYLHKEYLDDFDILQFNNSPGMENYEQMRFSRASHKNILFSPFNGGTNSLTPAEKLVKLTSDFPNSVILCSMFNETHIKSNAVLLNQ